MKFLHTSDWHLGAKLGEFSRLSEQEEVLEEIRKTADKHEVDFIIIAGDIFDNFNPSNESVELLYRELKRMTCNGKRPVIVIAGNHDSPDRIEAPDPLAAECGIFFIGYPDFTRLETSPENGVTVSFPEKGILTIQLSGKPQIRIICTPYANENRLRRYLEADKREEKFSEILAESWNELAGRWCDGNGINILTAHLFMTETKGNDSSEPEEERSILHPGGLDKIDAALLPGSIQYTALGHLHRPQTVRGGKHPVVYSGSPLAFGLSEEDQAKSAALVELEPGGSAHVTHVPLKCGRRVLRKCFSGIDEAVLWLNDNPGCYVELQIECDRYISGEDRKRLYDAHDGITAVIPVGRIGSGSQPNESSGRELPDLSGSVEELFISYFEYAKGIEPDAEIIRLFREVAAENGLTDDGVSE